MEVTNQLILISDQVLTKNAAQHAEIQRSVNAVMEMIKKFRSFRMLMIH